MFVETKQKVNINILNEKIIAMIISHLDSTNIGMLMGTNKQFSDLIKQVEEIDISKRNLMDNQMLSLINILPKMTKLERLNLSNNKIVPSHIEIFARTLGQIPSLTHLKLSRNFGGDIVFQHMLIIFKSLEKIPGLIHLSFNDISKIDYAIFTPILARMTKLTYLNLSRTSIKKNIIVLAPILAQIKTLTYLNLNDNEIDETDANQFASFLSQMSQLTHICVSGNSVSKELLSSLQNMFHLTHLEFAATRLTPKNISQIGAILNNNPTLTYLKLDYNKLLGVIGISELAPYLGQLSNLKHLDLGNINMGITGATVLASSLGQMVNLAHLNLSSNQIGKEGATALAPCLGQMVNLAHLDLSSNQIGEEGAIALVPSLGQMVKLTYLNLSSNCIREDGATALASSLGQMVKLTYLNLGFNWIGKKGTHILKTSVTDLPQMKLYF